MTGWLKTATTPKHRDNKPKAGVKFSIPTASINSTGIRLQKDPGKIPMMAANTPMKMKLWINGTTKQNNAPTNILHKKIYFLLIRFRSANHPKKTRATTSHPPIMATPRLTFVLSYPRNFIWDGIKMRLFPYPFIHRVKATAYITNKGFLNREHFRSGPQEQQPLSFCSFSSFFLTSPLSRRAPSDILGFFSTSFICFFCVRRSFGCTNIQAAAHILNSIPPKTRKVPLSENVWIRYLKQNRTDSLIFWKMV